MSFYVSYIELIEFYRIDKKQFDLFSEKKQIHTPVTKSYNQQMQEIMN